ncbi:SDR family NAD(P)-dependent oxidoreductase [Bauldia litoralis]|uniref:SDR family NAD(P)-dependent oxidoreductase n=1 Tax=Bauldia litoralis TaxID=665467 RepID=UPI003299466C
MSRSENPTLPGDDAATTFSSFPEGGIAVVFGAGGGIGSALVERLRAADRFTEVIAFSRGGTPPIDLINEVSLAEAAACAAGHGDIRLAIDATGFLHDDAQGPEKSWRELDAEKLARAFALNAIGPALLMKHLLPRLPRSGKAVFATLSARVGSIGDNRLGGWYGYRASKAALSQLVRTASVELSRRSAEALCVALHPGTVATPLSAPFAATGLAVHTPDQSAAHLLAVIDALPPEATGGFFDWRGETVPW